MLPSDGGDEKKITFDPGSEMNPRFSDDGKKVYFTRMDMSLMTMGQGDRPESNLFVIYLEKQDKDPEEASNTPSPRAGRGPGGGGMPMDMIGGPDGGATPCASQAQGGQDRLGRAEEEDRPGHADPGHDRLQLSARA